MTFTAPWTLEVAGTPGDFRLQTLHPVFHTWMDADLVIPTRAVGLWGQGTLFACDAEGALLASPYCRLTCVFVGVISDIPIARIRLDNNSNLVIIRDFIFNPTPEPGTAALILAGAGVVLQRRKPRRIA